MKILCLRFTNLNSLQGSWEIDFTHASFASEGIFAITGRTGAGKSTILDAICLALFGQTPRLKTISASTNDIMSRHTGECSAEVEFSTHKGSYRVTWYQNRAHKKADGALQQPKHTLAELKTGDFLTGKTTDTVREVEEITGLNFTRFTRSVLLAQGSFAAFLQARDDERSDVLEQLTGTEIYSDISVAVYNQTKEERLKLERLQESIQTLRLLTPEEQEALLAQLEEQEKQRAVLHEEYGRLQGVLHWFTSLAQLEQDVKNITEKKAVLAKEKEAFMPLQEALTLALKALELDAPYTALMNQRNHKADLEKQLTQTNKSLEVYETEAVLRAKERERTTAILSDMRKRHQEERLVHIKVRGLDAELSQQGKSLQRAHTTLLKYQQERAEALQEATSRRAQVQEFYGLALQLYCQRFVRSSHHILTEGFWSLERLGQKIIELINERGSIKKEGAALARQVEIAQKNLVTAQKNLETGQKKLVQEQEKLKALEDEKHTLLAGESLGAFRTRYNDAQACMEQTQQAHGASLQGVEAACEWEKCEAHLAENQRLIDETVKAMDSLRTEQEERLKELESLEKERLLKSFEEHRTHLVDGEPCPLCGALDHPYIHETLSFGAGLEDALSRAKNAVQEGERRIAQCQVQLSEGQGRAKILMEQGRSHAERVRKNMELARDIMMHPSLMDVSSEKMFLNDFKPFAALQDKEEDRRGDAPNGLGSDTLEPDSLGPNGLELETTVPESEEGDSAETAKGEQAEASFAGSPESLATVTSGPVGEGTDFEAGKTGSVTEAVGRAKTLAVQIEAVHKGWLAKRNRLRGIVEAAEKLHTAIEEQSMAVLNARVLFDKQGLAVQESAMSAEGYTKELQELTQKNAILSESLHTNLSEWHALVRPLHAVPALPENLQAACLASLPAVPPSLEVAVDTVMAGWLEHNQQRMLEALGTVTPSLYFGKGGHTADGGDGGDGGRENLQGRGTSQPCNDATKRAVEGASGISGTFGPSGPFGTEAAHVFIDNIQVEQVEEYLAILASLRNRWLELESDHSQNIQRLSATLPLLKVAEETLHKATRTEQEHRNSYEEAQRGQAHTLQERHNLFGEKSLEEEEKNMVQREDEAEKAVTKAVSEENALEGRVAVTRAQGQKLAETLLTCSERLALAEITFAELLEAHSFTDETQFTSSCMDAVRRKQLEERAHALASRQIELESQEREKTILLQEKRQSPPSDEAEEKVAHDFTTVQHRIRQCDETIGGLREKVEQNALLEKQRQGRLDEIAAQQKEFGQWETLNALIGHSEGKKFRRFAQGLTFEAVVSEANNVLARLSERYTLLRDTENPLELNVCDSDQAGEIRSTRNLSGGESFIVSLALALGLSSMASRTVRLDSLFLDEGFGALDEDSLDVALDVLSSLPDDGKVIGIISHVTSLKERIRKNIQVIPMAGGRSRLEEGGGVKRM